MPRRRHSASSSHTPPSACEPLTSRSPSPSPSLPWAQRIELDLWYIERRSWRLDLTILWRSARLVVGGDGLYKGETGGWKQR
jgi:hypothetical protein